MDNARALFERALTAAPTDEALKLWDRFLAFEYEHGTLSAALAVQARASICATPVAVSKWMRLHI